MRNFGSARIATIVCWTVLAAVGPTSVWAQTPSAAAPADAAVATPAPAEPPVPAGLKPYEVRIEVNYGPDPRFTPRFREEMRRELADVAYKTVGQMWNVEIVDDNRFSPGRMGLERLIPEAMLSRPEIEKFDKVFLLSMEATGAQLTVWGVEWDRAGRQLGRIESIEAWQRRELADHAFALVRRLFSPLLTIERVRDATVELQLRAGDFPAPDPQAEQVAAGDFLAPLFRYTDRKGKVQGAGGVPWTYLLVESVERQYVKARLITVLRNPLGGKSRRVERLAVRLRPSYGGTKMSLRLASKNPLPLVGHQVQVYAKTFSNDETKTEPVDLVSDRRGAVEIPFNAAQPLVWLYVRSGKALLARIPYVPGVREADSLSLYDDSMRLAVEGEIRLLNGRVIDAVAKRMACVIRAQAFAEAKKCKEARAELAALDEVPGITEFQRQLNAIRVPALEAAVAAKNKSARTRIEQLCKDASDLINRHLAESTLKERRDAINSLCPEG